jgi:phosphatidylinositol alpha 1,6-mannosyltransferase
MIGDNGLARGLRIALFSGNYNYLRDGANQSLNRLVDFIHLHGGEVRVYSPTTANPDIPPNCPIVSVPSWPLPAGRGEYRLGRGLPSFVKEDLRRFDPHVFHTSAPDILGHRAVSMARHWGKPVAASVHTLFETYLAYYGMGFVEPALVALLRRYYNRCDRLLVTAEVIAERMRGQGITTPYSIWSRGVDHARFNPARRDLAWRRSFGIGDDELVLGFLGRLVLEKGLDTFARVSQALSALDVAHRVLVVGDGPARDDFMKMLPSASLAGFLTGDDVGRAMASFDIMLNPSVTETFGNVTLEAAACGVPVVAADATGNKAIVLPGKTGLLVPPDDISAYARAIASLAANPQTRAAMGAAAAAHGSTYIWDDINARVIDAYRLVIAQRGA